MSIYIKDSDLKQILEEQALPCIKCKVIINIKVTRPNISYYISCRCPLESKIGVGIVIETAIYYWNKLNKNEQK